MKKRFNVKNNFLIFFIISFSMFICFGTSIAESITIRVGGSQTPGHPATEATKQFAEIVNEKSNGQIKIEILFGVLGGEREIVEALQLGNIEMASVSDIGMSTVVRDIGFAYLPGLYRTYDEVDERYYNGWIGEEVKKRLERRGIKLLIFSDNDFRWVTNSVRPITKPEDIRGMSIRVPEIPELIQFYNELGANPTTMPITDLVTALQQGTIDGQDNGAILNYSFGFYEFQKYMTPTNHVFSGGGSIVNKAFWDRLSPQHQTIINEAIEESLADYNDTVRSMVRGFTEKMREAGVVISEPTPELEKAMAEAAQKVWENPAHIRRYGEDLMKRIVSEYGN